MSRFIARFLMTAACLAWTAPLAFAGSTQSAPAAHRSFVALNLDDSPYSAGLLMARAVHAGLVHPKSAASVGGSAPGLKCSPAPCTLPNVQASEGGQPVNETPISIDPTNPNHILTAGNDYNCTRSFQGYFVSTNAGSSFSHSCGEIIDGAQGEGDPIIGWDLQGVAFRGGIDAGSHFVIVLAQSNDAGMTWQKPIIAAGADDSDMDKPWLEIDTNRNSPRKNTLYVSVTRLYNNDSQIAVSHSADGGKSWSLVNVSTRQTWPNGVDTNTDMAIGDDGTVYLAWLRCSAVSGNCGGTKATMYMSKSTDGGVTWSTERKIHKVNLAPDNCGFYGCLPNTDERVSNIPVLAIDNSAAATHGRLYVMDYSWTGKYMQERVSASADGGSTWSAPVRVTPTTDKHDQFFQWLNVSADGLVGATWLDRSLDPANVNYDAFAAVSTDGGLSFGTNYRLSTVSSNPLNDGFDGGFMGDYTGNAWDDGKQKLLMSWTDTRNGSNGQDEVGGFIP